MININEIEAKDISLSSFKVKNELNPKFWPNGKLNSRVRLRLMDIADDFIQELSVDWVKPKDVIFTGSIANYNWSRYSDVDLHILIDFNKVYPKNKDFVDDYFKAKKETWISNHEDLKIFGFPIEISVEDSNEDNPSSGRYSLYKNKWIVEPNDFQDAMINQDFVKNRAAEFMTQIDSIEKKFKSETDTHKCEKYGDKVYKIFDKLKKLRTDGLASNKKEMSSGNIIYKIIRRAGYLDKIWDIVNSSYDKVNSIEENRLITEGQKKGEKFSAGIIPFRMNKEGKTEVFLGFPGQPKSKDFQAPLWMNRWQILKGHMENGEDPIKCAVREFCEESGVSPKFIKPSKLVNLGFESMKDGRKLICYGLDLTNDNKFDSNEFHSNLIDSPKYIELNNGVAYPEIERYEWKTVDNVGSSAPYETAFYRKCDEICQSKYVDKRLNEYLDKDVLMPLKKYLDKFSYEENFETNSMGGKYWNGEYTDEQKNDLLKKFYHYYTRFLLQSLEDESEEICANMTDEEYEDYYENTFAKLEQELQYYDERMDDLEFDENFAEMKKMYNNLSEKFGKIEEFKKFLVQKMHSGDFNSQLPTWSMQMYDNIHKKREWLIHFSDNAKDIASDSQFTNGNSLEDLAVTKSENSGNYAFAIPVDEMFFGNKNNIKSSYHLFQNGSDYGKEAILFQATGIKTWHKGDLEYQVIFDKNEASNIIHLQHQDDNWFITDTTTKKPIIIKKNLYDLVQWVITNFNQYAKRIVNESTYQNKTVIISETQTRILKETLNTEITAYHGSGTKFDKFDHSFMGTGEGAQAHGWGTYVTMNNDIAIMYSQVGSNGGLNVERIKSDINRLKEALPFRRGEAKEIGMAKLSELENELAAATENCGRFCYEVEIPDNNGRNYIEEEEQVPPFVWDAFVKKFRGENKQWAMNIRNTYIGGKFEDGDDYLWRDCIKALGYFLDTPKKASMFLHSLGYVGIHYDGRSDGECYVIFDENDINILNRTKL